MSWRARLAVAVLVSLSIPAWQVPVAAQRTPVAITVWFPLPTGGPLKEAMDDLVARFNSAQTDVKANLELTGDYGQNYQKLQTAIVAGTPPDAAMMELMQIPEFAQAGVLAPLDDWAKQPDFNFLDIAPALLGNSYWKGRLYAIPWQRSTTMMYYNIDAFKEAGLPEFSPPATWDDAQRLGPKLTVRQGTQITRYAIEGNFNQDWLFEGLVYSYGGKVISDDGRRAVFNEAPAVRALAMLRDLAKRDRTLNVNPNFSGIIENSVSYTHLTLPTICSV